MKKLPRSDLVAASDQEPLRHNTSRTEKSLLEPKQKSIKKSKVNLKESARTTSTFIPPLSLKESSIEKFENAQRPPSRSISRYVENKSKLETPRSISLFVMSDERNIELINASHIIKKNWAIYHYKKKLRFFLNFVLTIRRRRVSYAFSMWVLTTQPKLDVAQRAYSNIMKFLSWYRFIYPKSKTLWMFKNSNIKLMHFDEYMKTNILYTTYPKRTIIKMQKNFNHQLVHNVFEAWFSMTSERLVIAKASPKVQHFVKCRENFGPEYWTFHVWRRWANYKKKRQLLLVETIDGNVYIPEWTFYRAKKLTEAHMRRNATIHYKTRLGKTIIQLFRDTIHHQNALKEAYSQTVEFSNRLKLIYGYRGFSYLMVFKRLDQGILQRAIRAWYTIIDTILINRIKIKVFYERRKLKMMQNSFKSWRKSIHDELICNAYLHDQVSKKRSKILPIIFLLKGDHVHFTFIKAFTSWRYLLIKKNNLKKFVHWSIKGNKKQIMLRYILGVLKDNSGIPFNYVNYQPFSDSVIYALNHDQEQKCLTYPTTSLTDTITAYHNIPDFPIYEDDWSQYASSLQVRSLFFRLICLLSHKNKLKIVKTHEQRIKAIEKFVGQNQLFNHFQINELRKSFIKQDIERKKELGPILKRDAELILAYESHQQAIKLSQHLPSFSLNKTLKIVQPVATISTSTNENENDSEMFEEEEEEAMIEVKTTSRKPVTKKLERNRRRVSRGGKKIPFLLPISDIKDSIMRMTMKYRRRPKDVFAPRNFSSRKPRQSLDVASFHNPAKVSYSGSLYENFLPCQYDQNLVDLMKSKDFSIKELQELKKQIIVNIEEEHPNDLETIPENQEIEYYSEEEIEEEEEEAQEKEEAAGIKSSRKEDIPQVQEQPEQPKKSPEKITFGFESLAPEPTDEKKDEKIPTKSLTKKNETTERLASIQQVLYNEDDTIDEMANHFLNDANYFQFDQSSRVSLLTNEYFKVMEILLGPPSHQDYEGGTVQNSQTEEWEPHTDVSKLLKRISKKIEEENSCPIIKKEKRSSPKQRSPRPTTPQQSKKKGRKKLFEDPDEQFETEIHADGHSYQKSSCPEFAQVLFSGQTVLSNTPWQIDSPESTPNPSHKPFQSPVGSLPAAEAVVAGFETPSEVNKKIAKITKVKSATSMIFLENNLDIKEQLEEILKDENIEDKDKLTILNVINNIAKKYIEEEAKNRMQGEITSLVDINNSTEPSSDNVSESCQVFHLTKPYIRPPGVSKKYAAFDTDSRYKKPSNSFKAERLVFYKDLAMAVVECSRFMSSHLISEPKNIFTEQSAFESLKILKKIQQNQLNARRKASEIHSRTVPLNLANPVTNYDQVLFTAGGVTKRLPPYKVQSSFKSSTNPHVQYEKKSKTSLNKTITKIPESSSCRTLPDISNLRQNRTTTTLKRTIGNSNEEVPLIEITRFEVNMQPAQHRRPNTQQSTRTKKPKQIKVQSKSNLKTLHKPSEQKRPMTAQSPENRANSSLYQTDDDFEMSTKQTPVLTSRTTKISTLPIPLPENDQSEKLEKRKPQFTKYEATQPELPVEFVFEENQKRKDMTTARTLDIPLRLHWKVPNDKKKVRKKDLKYFMYVTPFVESNSNPNENGDEQGSI